MLQNEIEEYRRIRALEAAVEFNKQRKKYLAYDIIETAIQFERYMRDGNK